MNNLSTYKDVIMFEEYFGNSSFDYNKALTYLKDEILLNSTSVTYNYLLEKLKGGFPLDVYQCLSDIEKLQINFDNPNKCVDLRIEDDYKLPPPHLINYEWRYSRKSAEKILDSIDINKNICCLGTPTLAIELIRRGASNVAFLDINEPMVNTIKSKIAESENEYFSIYNVIDDLPENFINKFDVVLTNPPWYLDYYKLFIYRSIQLLKNETGTIIIPIFPVLARHNAYNDLLELFKFIKSSKYIECNSLGYIDYLMPDFEKFVLEENNVPIPAINWRKSELIEIKYNFTNDVLELIDTEPIKDFVFWDRNYSEREQEYYAVNTKCLFSPKYKREFKQETIKTISRKNIPFRKIVIWNNNKMIIGQD